MQDVQVADLMSRVRVFFDAEVLPDVREGILHGIELYQMERGITAELELHGWDPVFEHFRQDEIDYYDSLIQDDPKSREMWEEEKANILGRTAAGEICLSAFWEFYVPERRYADAPNESLVDIFIAKNLDGASAIGDSQYGFLMKGREEPSPIHAIGLQHRFLRNLRADFQFGVSSMLAYHGLTRMEQAKYCERPTCIYTNLSSKSRLAINRLQTHYRNSVAWSQAPTCSQHQERIQRAKAEGIISIDPVPLIINS